jgi:AmmeMemoRadiSam system protein B
MNIRQSVVAGSWYPGDPELLTKDLTQYLAQARVLAPNGKLWGVLAPHAGYYYSGPVAAYAFKCLQGQHPAVVVIVSPLHHVHSAPLLTTAYEAYETPLGLVEVDRSAVSDLDRALEQHLGIGLTPLRHDKEHSLEIELPFLQHVLGDFRLLPVMMRDQQATVAEALGLALAETLQGQQVLFIVSSDLSHFYRHDLACEFDQEMLRRLERFDPPAIMAAEEEGAGFACGRGAIAAVLWATKKLGANRITVVRHATSGDISGDYSSVVGYGAAVIWQSATSEVRV